jgi:membrane protease YdiL (CAAX protease family)
LDRQVGVSRQADPGSWGPWPWLGPVLSAAGLVLLGRLTQAELSPHASSIRTNVGLVLSAAVDVMLLAAAIAFGRPIAHRSGGWKSAFGVDLVRRVDWRPWMIGMAATFVGRLVVSLGAAAATHGSALKEARNVQLHNTSITAITALLILTVLLAPPVEELVFRGLLLRTFMRRMTFWPAACLSTAIFASFHVFEVKSVAGAVTLAGAVAALGLTNCVLVRLTGRLAPGVFVHAAFNLLGVLIVVHQAKH